MRGAAHQSRPHQRLLHDQPGIGGKVLTGRVIYESGIEATGGQA